MLKHPLLAKASLADKMNTMPEDSPYQAPVSDFAAKPRGKSIWWFLYGFVPSFLWLLVFGTYTYYRTMDHVVVSIKLWAFYYRKAKLSLGFADTQEPKRLLGSSFLEAIIEHLFYSAIAGLIFLGVGLLIRFVRRRSKSETRKV